jgi:hypothetical protein
MPVGLPEPFADGLSSAMAQAAAAMRETGDPSALRALRAKLAELEAENLRLRAAKSQRRQGMGEEEEDEAEANDRRTLALYEAARQEVMDGLARGTTPTAEQYSSHLISSHLISSYLISSDLR